MLRAIYRISLVLTGIALTGCDSRSPAAPEPDTPRYSEEDEIPPEYNIAPSIGAHRTEAGFTNTTAYAMGHMDYYGNRATHKTRLTLRKNDAVLLNTEGESEEQGFFPSISPGGRHLHSTASAGIRGVCGYMVDGSTVHTAWSEFWSPKKELLTWDREVKTSFASADQGPVNAENISRRRLSVSSGSPKSISSTCEGSSGGGGSGNNDQYSCVTVTEDHYWYYPDTGQVEYRYTTTTTVCNFME